MSAAPRLLVTGFGPFPGAPDNPTEALVNSLAASPPEAFGASAFEAIVLPTDYRESWAMLEAVYARFAPDVVVHFGVNGSAKALHIETTGRNVVDPLKPDSAGYAPPSGQALATGPQSLRSSLSAERMLAALQDAKIAAALSDDAGDYVCNATLFRSLYVAPAPRRIGFVHVPPAKLLAPERLLVAAECLLRAATAG